jgi:hypothetical protein
VKRLLALALPLAVSLIGCGQMRNGGELRLKHEVTVATPEGERTFTSVVSMDAYQRYNYHPGGSGWGGIACRLTGSAVRMPVGDKDFFFLLDKGSTPAWDQIELIKEFFGLPNATDDDSWVERWKTLAKSNLAVPVPRDAYPQIAVMPSGGTMDEARKISLDEAEAQGLRIIRYRLQITREAVGANPPYEVRFNPPKEKHSFGRIGRESFTVVDGAS